MSTVDSMHEAIKTFILSRKIKKEELLLTTKLEKDQDGGLNKILIKTIKSSGRCPDEELKIASDRKKSKEEVSLEFHFKKYCDLAALSDKYSIDTSELREIYSQQEKKVINDHQYCVWLEENCKNAEYASVATHVSKLTHSSSKGTSFFVNTKDEVGEYLTTSSLKKIVVDGAYDNALYSPVVSLLLVEKGGRYFYEDLIQGKFEGLEGFTEDMQQLETWKNQLKKAIDKPSKSSHSLSKQIYFPVSKNPKKCGDWHLISVLASSSLAQDIFSRTGAKEFNDNSRNLKQKYRSKSLYSKDEIVDFPNKATLMVTQSSHQNTSVLNGKRSGRLFLLPSTPPTWQGQVKPPVNAKSWFNFSVPVTAYKEDVDYLRSFLLRFERIDLSTKDPKKRDWLVKWGARILSNVMFYAEGIQNLPPGWSNVSGIKLKQEQQYFLDPYRTDSTFQAEKEASDWQNTIANDFAQWLNKKIQGKDRKFTPQPEHSRLWKGLMLEKLREHNEMVGAILASSKGDRE